jgi:ferredoxin
MPKKYNIHTNKADPRFPPIGKYATVEFRENCVGSCRACVKKKCVYNIFKDNFLHWSSMADPEYLYTCKSCLRCVQECTKGIFNLAVNPDYLTLGDQYWTAQIINSTWAQAHTGAVPVSGAGYRGPFSGEGFDSIWTDMSEIVRPTRDGIHGREYINTTVELSRRPTRLHFNPDNSLAGGISPILEIPIPVVLDEPEFGVLSEVELLAMVEAAAAVGTLMFIRAGDYLPSFSKRAAHLVPCLTRLNYLQYQDMIKNALMVEIADEPGIESLFSTLRSIKPGLFLSVGLPLGVKSAQRALELAGSDVDTLHFYGSDYGRELDGENPRYMKDMIREIHLRLVDNKIRHKVNFIFSGGMALAEHVAKSLICGADAVGVDIPLLLALECRLCYRCKKGLSCPVQLEKVELKWATQRLVNLLGAWRNQLIEVMGAFGIREARRMRGEVGRSMWFEDLERDSFGPMFGKRKVTGIR